MSGLDLFLMQDAPMLAAGVLASVACGLIGSFLVLRRMSLMGDAISHAVLPGIVAGFLFAGTLQAMPIFIGAAVVGVLTAVFSEFIRRFGRVESGAAMGVVFTILFAIGVIMLERTAARDAHLDAECVLYGALEGVLWLDPPTSIGAIFSAAAWAEFPRAVITLAVVLVMNVLFIGLLFKELRIASFDPGLAKAQGVNPDIMHFLLMTMTAITVVAAFEAVGSILVVAMLIVPGLAAHLVTNRLAPLLMISAVFAAIAASGGYGAAVWLDTNSAASIGVALGVLLAAVGLLTPNGGWLFRVIRRPAGQTT